MKPWFLILFWIVASGLHAETGIRNPAYGFTRADDGSLRRVAGVHGNLLVQDVVAEGVISSAFWTGGGTAKTESRLLVYDAAGRLAGSFPAPRGSAVTGFDRMGKPRIIHFPEGDAIWLRSGAGWRSLTFDVAGEVVAAEARSGPTLIVRRGERLWRVRLSARTGRPFRESPLPGLVTPFLMLPDGRSVSIEEGDAVVRELSGAESRTKLPFPVDRIELAGEGTVSLVGSEQCALLRVDSLDAGVAMLPGGSR